MEIESANDRSHAAPLLLISNRMITPGGIADEQSYIGNPQRYWDSKTPCTPRHLWHPEKDKPHVQMPRMCLLKLFKTKKRAGTTGWKKKNAGRSPDATC
jgi:hypothetical protein